MPLQIYMAGVIYFAVNNAYAALSAFLPTIIQTFGVCTFNHLRFRTFLAPLAADISEPDELTGSVAFTSSAER